MTLIADTATNHRWLELISDPALLCDEAAIILRANRSARALFSFERSEYNGVPVSWIIPAKSREHFLRDWDRRSRPKSVSGPRHPPMWVRDSQQRSIPTWMVIEEFSSFGKLQFVLVFKDAAISYSHSHSGLGETELSNHLSSIRHDIRNPLSGIKVFTDVLLRNRRGNLGALQLEQLGAIKNAAGRLAVLIDEIDFPRR